MAFLLMWASPRFAQAVDALLFQDTFVRNSGLVAPPPVRTHYLTINAKNSAYLWFDFQSVLPGSERPRNTNANRIERAILRIYVAVDYVPPPPRSGPTPPPVYRGLRVYGLTSPFQEDQPYEDQSHDATPTAEAIVPRQGNFLDLDITPLVRAWVSGARGNIGLALKAEAVEGGDPSDPQPHRNVPADIRIPSKENPTCARQARLQLFLRPAAATP